MPYVGPDLAAVYGHAPRAATSRLLHDLARRGGTMMADFTKQNTPIQTGRLRDSIKAKPVLHEVDTLGRPVFVSGAETEVEYACVFGANTPVLTREGARGISRVRVGDEVLTQTGEYQRVTATSAMSVIDAGKADLIDIEVAWRADKSHRLTLTMDHKVLVLRDGRNLWVAAGDLRGDDLLYDKVKAAHNLGSGRLGECDNCGRRFRLATGARRYCSVACRDQHWAKGHNPHLGMKRSREARERMQRAARARNAGAALNRRLAELHLTGTSIEDKVEEWLIQRGVEYERQVTVGSRSVDFYLPASGEIIEADGAYWHQDQAADIERDRELLRELPGVEVTHLHFYEARFTPSIDPTPIPGVQYVVCNPSPGSFVDQTRFSAKPILSRREWRYGDKAPEPRGSWSAKVYDLSVEGVSSFLAGGVLVHNCDVEYGTGLWGPKHAKYTIYPSKPGGFLSWVTQTGFTRKNGEYVPPGTRVFAKKVEHPGSPGQHMFAMGAAKTEAEFSAAVSDLMHEWREATETAMKMASKVIA